MVTIRRMMVAVAFVTPVPYGDSRDGSRRGRFGQFPGWLCNHFG
jgi:hypothetical protein